MTRWARVAVVVIVLALVAGYVTDSGHWFSNRCATNDGPAESGEANGWEIEVEWATAEPGAAATGVAREVTATPAMEYTIVVTVPAAADGGR